MNRDGVNLTFPRTDVFARQFVGFVPEFLTLVTIHRGHLTQPDDEYAVYWRGRVGVGQADRNSIILACESIFTSLRRFGLRALYTHLPACLVPRWMPIGSGRFCIDRDSQFSDQLYGDINRVRHPARWFLDRRDTGSAGWRITLYRQSPGKVIRFENR